MATTDSAVADLKCTLIRDVSQMNEFRVLDDEGHVLFHAVC